MLNNYKKYFRRHQHYLHVETRVLELREKITIQAIETGCVDRIDRTLFVKYNDYLKKLAKF